MRRVRSASAPTRRSSPRPACFRGWLNWINVQQQGFYRSLTGALKAMREDGGKLWLLVGLSFAYGVFHAAGPGHGKAVISSYMLANEVALRRGVMLSFVSAFLQALTAILVMTLVFLVLRGTAVSMTDATWFLEVASYVLITLFGAWLLWQKAGPRLLGAVRRRTRRTACRPRMRMRHAQSRPRPCRMRHGHAHSHAARASRRSRHHGHHAMPRAPRSSCAMRMRTHAGARSARPAATATRPTRRCSSGDRFNWQTAWSAVVGGRPAALLRRADRADLRLPERALGRRRAVGLRHGARHRDHRVGAGDARGHGQELGGGAVPATAAPATASTRRSRSAARRWCSCSACCCSAASLAA